MSQTSPLTPVDVRIRISALWAATMFLFAYVDLFTLFRPDFRQTLDSGRVFVFDLNGAFLLGTTIYVAVPSLLIYLSLVLPWRMNRVVNIVAAAVYGVTIVGGAIGEWGYYVFGSVLEVALLALVMHHAWTWRPLPRPSVTNPPADTHSTQPVEPARRS